jgi:hypothetical protein
MERFAASVIHFFSQLKNAYLRREDSFFTWISS